MFGVIFEKTVWIAEKLFKLKPFKDKNDLINFTNNNLKKYKIKKIENLNNSKLKNHNAYMHLENLLKLESYNILGKWLKKHDESAKWAESSKIEWLVTHQIIFIELSIRN